MKILILGRLPSTKNEEEWYNSIINICNKHGNVFDSPIDTKNFNGSDEERYKKAFEKVKKADLIIAESSSPSTGQGMEIREADILDKQIIIVAKENSKVSGMIKGCNSIKEIIYYSNLEDLSSKLNNYFG